MSEANKATVRRLVEEVQNRHDLARMDAFSAQTLSITWKPLIAPQNTQVWSGLRSSFESCSAPFLTCA